MRKSRAWERLRTLEASPEFERVVASEFPYRSVALAVVDLRGRLRLTQQQLAEQVGTTQSVIARLESGKHPVEVTLLSRVADATGEPLVLAFGHRELYERISEHDVAGVAEQMTEYEPATSGDDLLDAFNQANTSADFETAGEIAQRMLDAALTPRRRVALALTAANQHDYQAAAKWASQALAGDLPLASRDVATLVYGRALLQLHTPRKALQAMTEPVGSSSLAWLIRAARADAYVELGRDNRAMQEVREAIELAPGVAEVRYHAARTAWHSDRVWEALDHIAVYRAAEPDSPEGIMLHGSILGYIGSEQQDPQALRTALALFKRVLGSGCEAVRLYAVTAAQMAEWKVAFRAASRFLKHRGEDGSGQCEHTRTGLDHRHYVTEHFLPLVFEAIESKSPVEREAAIDEAVTRFGPSPLFASQRALVRAVAGDLAGTLSALSVSRDSVGDLSANDQSIVAAAMYYRRDFGGAYEVLHRIEPELSRPEGLLRLAECAAAAGEVADAQRVLRVLAESDDVSGRAAQVAVSTIRLQGAIAKATQLPVHDLPWFQLTGPSEPMTPRQSPWEGQHHPTTPLLEGLPARSPLN